jgi:hypothetical protein
MKPYCVISCPIDTYSGYGARARDFVKALYEIKKDEWDIQVLPQRWGATPWGYIQDNISEWGWVNSITSQNNQLQKQPDYWYQITIPNEFQPIGKLMNVGVTAGIETTICDASWIEGVNRMNVTYVSSNHAKKVFETTMFRQQNEQGHVVREIKLEKPIQVLFEGADLSTYFHKSESNSSELVKSLDEIKEEFCYLYVGHWTQGAFGEDRKNVGKLIKLFLETFKDKKKRPALVLKTSQAGSSIIDRDTVLEKINEVYKTVDGSSLPQIYLLHGEVEDSDMNDLYNHKKIKALVSLTKGEGFGRPLLEFTLSKKPIITTNWSGHIDFLSNENCVLLPGQLTKIHPSAVVQGILIQDSEWFSVDEDATKKALVSVYEKYDKFLDGAKKQAHRSKTEFSFDSMKNLLSKMLETYPKYESIQLPQLKKIELPKLKKVD